MGIITGHSGSLKWSNDGGQTWAEVPCTSWSVDVPDPPSDPAPPIRLPRSFSISFRIRIIALRDVWYRHRAAALGWPRHN